MNDVPKAQAMSDAEVEAQLDSTGGLLKLENMAHADDIMLELAGIGDRDRVTLGGVVQTRNSKKSLSTNVQIIDRTFIRGQNLNPHLYIRRRNQHESQRLRPS